MISNFKKNFEPLLAIIAQPFLSWNPHVLTLLSLVAAILFFIGISYHIYVLALMSIIGFLFDALDGYVARKQGKETAFGGFLDSTTDRIADFLFIISFAYGGLISWQLATVTFGTSFLISYMRSRGDLAFGLGHAGADGLMQRPERIILIYVALLGFLFLPQFDMYGFSLLSVIFSIIIILNFFTIFQRLFFFYRMQK